MKRKSIFAIILIFAVLVLGAVSYLIFANKTTANDIMDMIVEGNKDAVISDWLSYQDIYRRAACKRNK